MRQATAHFSRFFSAGKTRRLFVALLAGATVLAVGLGPAMVRAKETDHIRLINLIDRQGMLLEKMSKETLLIALEVDTPKHLKELERTRDQFDRTHVGLRNGDAELGLAPVESPAVLDLLAQIEGLWPYFDDAVRGSLRSGAAGRPQIDTLAEFSPPLFEAIDGTADLYLDAATGGQLRSMLPIAIHVSSRQSMLTQRMMKEFLLIAYQYEARKNRRRLKRSSAFFGESLEALIRGDLQRKLMPPPNNEIKLQLDKVDQLWREFQPLIGAVKKGGKPSRDEILRAADLNARLLLAMDRAVSLYESF